MPDPVSANVARFVAGQLTKSLSTKTGRRRLWSRFKLLCILAIIGLGVGFYYAPDKVRGIIQYFLAEEGIELQLPQRPSEASQSGPVRVYFTRPNAIRQDNSPAHALAEIIDQTKKTIDVAGFEIDNEVIVQALVRAVQRGVKVRVVTDTDYINESGPTTLRGVGVPIVDDRREAFMHNKFMVFDSRAIWTGSMNFTENCAYRNNNHAVYLEVPQLAENYETKFNWMFEDRIFGKAKLFGRIPHPVVTLPDGTVIENYFSTHDHVADHIIRVVGESQTSIDFLAFSFTHSTLGKLMLDKARSGIQVAGVFEKSQASSGHSEYTAMKTAGLPVFLDVNPRNMHHKVILIDGTTTICGSFNFSANADKSNDENILIFRNNPSVGHQFAEEFSRVYDPARNAGN